MNNQVVSGLFKVAREHLVYKPVLAGRRTILGKWSLRTVGAIGQLNHIADANVDDTQEALILLLKLLLVKYLDCQDTVLIGAAA